MRGRFVFFIISQNYSPNQCKNKRSGQEFRLIRAKKF